MCFIWGISNAKSEPVIELTDQIGVVFEPKGLNQKGQSNENLRDFQDRPYF